MCTIGETPKKASGKIVSVEPWYVSIFTTLQRLRTSKSTVPHFRIVMNELFLKRVQLDQDWSLFVPRQVPDLESCAASEFEALYCAYEATTGKAARVVKARAVHSALITTQEETGFPEVVFKASPPPRAAVREPESDEKRNQREETLLQQVRETGSARVFSADLTSEARRSLTLAADRAGFVAYKELDSVSRKPVLVIVESCNEVCDPNVLTVPQLKIFSDLCNVPMDDPATLSEDMKLYGVSDDSLAAFVDDVRRFSLNGLKRRDRILQQEIVLYLAAQPEYIAFQQLNPPPTLEGKMNDAFTISQRVYNRENANCVFFSIDLKGAIFQCYRDLGIVKDATTWSEFVKRFTSSRTFAMNKFVRNCIFGELDKKNTHPILWKNAIWRVWQQVLTAWPEAAARLVAIENDEFILACPGGDNSVAADAKQLIGPCGLGALCDAGRINLRCYKLYPLKLEATSAEQPAELCYIRQMVRLDPNPPNLTSGRPMAEYDIKCVKRPNRKRAMLMAQSHVK